MLTPREKHRKMLINKMINSHRTTIIQNSRKNSSNPFYKRSIQSSFLLLIFTLFNLFILPTAQATTINPNYLHHELKIHLDLNKGELQASDTIHLPSSHHYPYFEFSLNQHFQLEHQGNRINKYKNQQTYNIYRIPLAQDQKKITLTYSGPLPSTPECQFTLEICSLLNEKGVYLNPALAWYPMSNELHTFQLNATLLGLFAQSWKSLTQGKQIKNSRQKHLWQMDKPQDAIYFIAGSFSVYQKKGDVAEAQVYLLNDDPRLAQRYLDKTLKYLST
ncbi:MAG TPA: hypothetical protein ENK78_03380, partial [Thiothrix sp.]|nr:hypothetical protein [Thiothrix sp.]